MSKSQAIIDRDEMGSKFNSLVEKLENEDTSNNTSNYSEWIESDNQTFFPSIKVITHKKLQPGLYDIDYSHTRESYFFKKKELVLDELIKLPDPTFNLVLKDMEYFWNNEQNFIDYNFAYKRGILLYGPPGCGKTSLTALLSNYLVKNIGGIVFSIKTSRDLDFYSHAIPDYFKVIENKTPILTLIEDLDGLLAFKENETMLLNILDGFKQINNAVYIGCTNYPEQLKDRILNRPSRFDKRYYIGKPLADVRKFYLENKIKNDDLNKYSIDDIVKKTEGLSLAHIGELIKSVYIFGKELDESIEELHNMSNFISSTKFEKNDKPTGFLSNK
jgi:AAA+ superfamily predicted ATPase